MGCLPVALSTIQFISVNLYFSEGVSAGAKFVQLVAVASLFLPRRVLLPGLASRAPVNGL